jgi:hypothetical protein
MRIHADCVLHGCGCQAVRHIFDPRSQFMPYLDYQLLPSLWKTEGGYLDELRTQQLLNATRDMAYHHNVAVLPVMLCVRPIRFADCPSHCQYQVC